MNRNKSFSKTVSKKNIVINFYLSIFLIAISCENGNGMKKVHPKLDQEWKWAGAPKLSRVIGMPSLDTPEENLKGENRIRVAVPDQRLNFEAVDLSESCSTMNYSENEKYDHATHVADTIKVISPTTSIHNHLGIGDVINLENAFQKIINNKKIHVINISIGAKPEGVEIYSKGEVAYESMMAAAKAGKIIVQALGNEYPETYNPSFKEYYDTKIALHTKFCEALMDLAEHSDMQGRLILVANADYSINDDLLEASSSRPHRYCKYVITAPGTDIYACVGLNKYGKKTGTSMAAPIVSGIIAQLLNDYWKQFFWSNLGTIQNFKDIIVKGVLENARHNSMKHGKPLGVEFGCGVINYTKAKEAIEIELSDLYRKKYPKGWAALQESERKEIDRKEVELCQSIHINTLFDEFNLRNKTIAEQDDFLCSQGFGCKDLIHFVLNRKRQALQVENLENKQQVIESAVGERIVSQEETSESYSSGGSLTESYSSEGDSSGDCSSECDSSESYSSRSSTSENSLSESSSSEDYS